MKDLKQVTVIGMGLLGGSIALGVLRAFNGVKVVGYSHRASTRRKSRELLVSCQIMDDIKQSVASADIVILATPICTFEGIFEEISEVVPSGCIVTDVGSTKVLPSHWASKKLRKDIIYIGSHPIAGSEQRGIEYARDDLLYQAMCVLT
ncbi:MAG: prephenate dehydrogenase/arogenate dehydrogenase family protein, partial [Sedimentisphaerales bacterium]|nr:prephenate dehydrogenase/arogenate dehydrogenase family protein [Sedimentisphaerales bacterium]